MPYLLPTLTDMQAANGQSQAKCFSLPTSHIASHTCVTLDGFDPCMVMTGGTVSAAAGSEVNGVVTFTTGTKI